jgi:hypothetical protein
MTSRIDIELFFNSELSKETLFEFRNYLRSEIPGFEFNFRETPALPGRMGMEDQLLNAVLYATTVAAVEIGVHKTLESINENIVEKLKQIRDRFIKTNRIRKLDISGSVRYDATKSRFKIEEGKISYYNDRPYSIDPDHTYVLLAGCGEFQSLTITKIPSVERNLTELYQLMTELQYFGIPADHVAVSLNQNNDIIQEKLYDISRKSGIETFIFYYVGHGFCTDKDSYFLAANNTQKKDDFINGGIDKEFIKNRILTQSPAKQKIAIIDACYSGILTQGGSVNMFDIGVIGSYILTSSNADEVSFFDKNEPFTFFTSALINVIKSGINNENESITLDDLYIGTSKLLKGKNLQQPTYKNGLNLDPSKFIISHNPSFSSDIECDKPNQFIKEGKYDDASYEFKRLINKYPDNKKLQEDALEFEKHWLNSKILNEADNNYYKLRKFNKAKDLYNKSLGLKEDRIIREKMNKCISILEKNKNKRISFSRKTIISFFAIFGAAAISFLIFHKSEYTGNNASQDQPKVNTPHNGEVKGPSLTSQNDSLTSFYDSKKALHGFINSKGDTIIKAVYYYANDFSEGLASVRFTNGFYGYIDKSGKAVIPFQYDIANDFSEGLATVMFKGKWSIIDKSGKEAFSLNTKYKSVESFSEGLLCVYTSSSLDGKYGFIDKYGKEIIPTIYDYASSFSDGLALVHFKDDQYFINRLGNKVIPLKKYFIVDPFSEGLAQVSQMSDGFYYYGFIDTSGKEVIPLKYPVAFDFSEGLALVGASSKYGFIDKSGKEVIPLKYEDARSFYRGLAYVTLKGKYFYIDKNGNYVKDAKEQKKKK